ncbi:MAG: endonuclease III [Candidatus Thermoplasmatota archaeon]|nr:endonuclease III [Candidatus Thermoplasmatota archaeon]
MKLATAKQTFEDVFTLISSQSPQHHFEFHDPFWVLITTIMSHRTKDEITDSAARSLFNRYGDSFGLADASYSEVLSLISKVGFSRVKAARVINAAKIISEKYGGRVPSSIEELMSIPGVGRKTANVVLADSFGIPAIAVDTHVLRISNRIGWAHSNDPEEVERTLLKIVPENRRVGFNPTLVEFGKKVCRPIGPRCDECKIRSFCEYYNKKRKKGN